MENRFKDEVWKDICFCDNGNVCDFSGLYQVSNYGRVKSFKKDSNGIILKNLKYENGYEYVYLGTKKHKIHRLVAHMFIPNIENKLLVDHVNTDRSDNRVENLRWATHFENNNNKNTYAKRHGANWFSSKSVYLDDHLLAETVKDASDKLGITYSTLRRWLNGTTKMPKEWEERNLYQTGGIDSLEKSNNGRAVAVMLDGKILCNSIREASEKLNINISTLSGWLNSIDKMPEEYILRGLKKIKIKKEVSDSIY